jgi:cytochrome c
LGNDAYIGYHNIDLNGIRQIEFVVSATPSNGDVGGTIEVHLDSPGGKLIGRTEMIESKPLDFAKIMQMMEGKAKSTKTAPAKADTSKKKQAPEFDFDMLEKLLAVHAVAGITPSEGMHNIYFVFKNSNAKSNEPLMQVSSIGFKNAVTPPVKK